MEEKLNQLETLRAQAGLEPMKVVVKSEKVVDDLIVYFQNINKKEDGNKNIKR